MPEGVALWQRWSIPDCDYDRLCRPVQWLKGITQKKALVGCVHKYITRTSIQSASQPQRIWSGYKLLPLQIWMTSSSSVWGRRKLEWLLHMTEKCPVPSSIVKITVRNMYWIWPWYQSCRLLSWCWCLHTVSTSKCNCKPCSRKRNCTGSLSLGYQMKSASYLNYPL